MKNIFKLILLVCGLLGSFNALYAQTAREWFNKAKQTNDDDIKVQYYTKAIESGFEPLAIIYNDRASTYVNLGKYSKAIDDYNRAIELDPNSSTGAYYHGRGMAKDMLGLYDDAIADFNIANPSCVVQKR